VLHRIAAVGLSTALEIRVRPSLRTTMNLLRLFGTAAAARAAALYGAIVAQARQPDFYVVHGVPDTVDGRFEMIALHMFLVLHRLKPVSDDDLAQQLFDIMFGDMDQSLREMGAGDLGVGRRVRAMAEGLYGRMAAYEAGLATDDEHLAAAWRRNVFGTVPEPGPSAAVLQSLCGYLRAAAVNLQDLPVSAVSAGDLRFPAVSRTAT
jgi:cytochrome b pre-mRNA-processing protein 3